MVQPTRLITLAVVAALAAAALVTVLQQTLTSPDAGPRRGLAGRLVTTLDLSAGHRLIASDVAPAPNWKATEEEVTAVTRAVVGRPLANNLNKGQTLQEADLAARGSGPALVGQIPAGSRAITVMLREAGPGVVLFPGAMVDVLATIEVPTRGGGARETVTRPIVEGVRVLAVNQDAVAREAEAPERRSLPRRMTVTLLTSPAQASQIELASTKGTIGLILRPEGDANPSGSAPATTETLVGVERARSETVTAAPETTPKPSTTNPSPVNPPNPPSPSVWEVIVVKGDETVRHPFQAGSGKGSDNKTGSGGSPR